MKFIVCISREGFGDFATDDLTLGRLYESIEPEDERGMVRVMDDSGEDYLYPAKLFEPVEVQGAPSSPTACLILNFICQIKAGKPGLYCFTKHVNFKCAVTGVRPATQEQINHGHVHGEGEHHH